MDDFKDQLKAMIIEALNLDGMEPSDIENDAPLFGGGLGLDSIDVLELIVLLEKNWGIKLSSPQEGKAVFASVDTMAEYIEAHRSK